MKTQQTEIAAIVAEMQEIEHGMGALVDVMGWWHRAAFRRLVTRLRDRLAVLSSHLQVQEETEVTDTRVGDSQYPSNPLATAASNEPVPPEPQCDRCGHLLREHVFPGFDRERDTTHRNCARCNCTRPTDEAPTAPTEYDRLKAQYDAIVARRKNQQLREFVRDVRANATRLQRLYKLSSAAAIQEAFEKLTAVSATTADQGSKDEEKT